MDAPLNIDPVTAQSGGDVVHWLTNHTRDERFIDNIFAELCVRLQRAGIPVKRASLHLLIYHPQWLGARIMWADAAAACDARLLNVEVVCPDQAEHRRRVETRRSDIAGLDLPDWERVQGRDYEDWTGNPVVLDTSKLSVNDCVKSIIEALAHTA